MTFLSSRAAALLAHLSCRSRYQLRLFCTSSTFYAPSTPTAFRTSNGPCPIEFPPTCEVRVNGTQLTANLKGLKKKPGTAPPPDLGSAVRWNTSGPNRIEMVYVNSSQPAQAKVRFLATCPTRVAKFQQKFFLVVMLVATNSVESLVEDLKANSRRSNTEIKQKSKSPSCSLLSQVSHIRLSRQCLNLRTMTTTFKLARRRCH